MSDETKAVTLTDLLAESRYCPVRPVPWDRVESKVGVKPIFYTTIGEEELAVYPGEEYLWFFDGQDWWELTCED